MAGSDIIGFALRLIYAFSKKQISIYDISDIGIFANMMLGGFEN